jgi:hypothetical protein
MRILECGCDETIPLVREPLGSNHNITQLASPKLASRTQPGWDAPACADMQWTREGAEEGWNLVPVRGYAVRRRQSGIGRPQ